MTKMARLGMFILAALGILFAGIFIIGNQQRMFTRSYRLRAQFPGVSGLLSGAEVRVGGLRKGTVEEIRLPSRPTDPVTVTLSLDHATSTLVKADSLAAIETEGLLGSKYLAISFGSPGAAAIKDGDTIASVPPLDMSDMLKKSERIMEATHRTITTIDTLAREVALLASRINHGEGTLGALMNDRTLYDHLDGTAAHLEATSAQARATMAEARVGVTAFQENMEALKRNILFRGYFKARGYLDPEELTRWEIPALPSQAPARTFSFSTRELFGKADGTTLTDGKRLKEVGATLEGTPFSLVVIQVFSDRKGDRDGNLVLTRVQAVAVRAALADRFRLDDARLKTKGMGEGEAGQEGSILISIYGRKGD